jgi:hypothetical protein
MKLLLAFLILTTNSLLAQEWKELSLKSYGYISSATSELDDGEENEERINFKYGVINLFDGDCTTAWVEGAKGNGIGESVFVAIPNDCQTISIFAGYGKSPVIYSSNNRVKRIKLSCYIGINPEGGVTELDWLGYMSQKFPGEFHIDLKDAENFQTFSFPFPHQELIRFRQEVLNNFNRDYKLNISHISTILQIEIEDVYKGSKYDDTCISELLFSSNRKGSIITKVYEEGKTKTAILFDTEQKKGNILVSDTNYVYYVMDTIRNNEWVIIERAPSRVGEGRVETEDMLFYVPEKREIPLQFSPLNFEKKDGIACLIGQDGKSYPLSDFLENTGPEPPERKEEPDGALSVKNKFISVDFDTVENEYGFKGYEKQLESLEYFYAIPGFGLFNQQVYIIDAMNFRVLVYDYTGKLSGQIKYPVKTDKGNWNIIRDICIDNGLLYLYSDNEQVIYVIDPETEDVINKIDGRETANKKFRSVLRIDLDNKKNLLVADTEDNSLNIYKRDGINFKLIKSVPYIDTDQLFFDSEGISYVAQNEDEGVALVSSLGETKGHFKYHMNVGGSNIIGIDAKGNIYIQTYENEVPGAQYIEESYIKVISPSGKMVQEIKVNPWPGGSITKDIIVDADGNIIAASLEGTGNESPDDETPARIVFYKLK